MVLLVAPDRLGLRDLVRDLPDLGRAHTVACWLREETAAAPPAVQPTGPALVHVQSRLLGDDGVLTLLRGRRPLPVVASATSLGASGTAVPARVRELLARPDELHLDVDLVNPRGFRAEPRRREVLLTCDDRGRVQVGGHDEPLGPADGLLTLVRRLHDHDAVRLSWPATPGGPMVRVVTALARAGVPIRSSSVPEWARTALGAGLSTTLVEDFDPADHLAREEHSVLLRRAAAPGWRRPSCTVVLPTRRPHNLSFALRQVARQRGVDLELVVAAHGFRPDDGLEARAGVPTTVVEVGPDMALGEVLTAGVAAASGEVIAKMDDDDWYGPHHLLDLLWARHHSGATVVGSAAEFVYLHELDRTVRRVGRAERYTDHVAGGTLVVDRSALAAVGGFRPLAVNEDAALLDDVRAAGGLVYRAHGLGYVLRRGRDHTWQAPVEYFVEPGKVRQSWAGFAPSRLLEAQDVDLPAG